LLEMGYNETKWLNKEKFYELMRKIEFSQKYEKNEFWKESFISNFEFTQNELIMNMFFLILLL
jgi:hypothetical protein